MQLQEIMKKRSMVRVSFHSQYVLWILSETERGWIGIVFNNSREESVKEDVNRRVRWFIITIITVRFSSEVYFSDHA